METKTNSGAIFKNTYKQPGDNKPEYKGEIDCDGVKKEIALWLKKSENGTVYFSVKLSDPYRKQEAEPAPEPVQDDDLPF